MSLINDYTYQAMTDQRERDLARLAEQQQAGSARTERSRELVAQGVVPSRTTTHRHCGPASGASWNGDAPAPGRALSATRSGVRARWHDSAYGSSGQIGQLPCGVTTS